jgi:hypothetical protein
MSANAVRLVLAGREPHALVERTVGPALCGYALAEGASWVLGGFTCWDLNRIGCLDCRQRAEALVALRTGRQPAS